MYHSARHFAKTIVNISIACLDRPIFVQLLANEAVAAYIAKIIKRGKNGSE